MNDIEERIDDAQILWNAGRCQGALLLALLAVVARPRQDFAKPIPEGESFRRFVESRFLTRTSLEYHGELWPLERVFYKWFRCAIVHEGGLPDDIRLMQDCDPDELLLRAGGAPDSVLLISPGWFYQLISWART